MMNFFKTICILILSYGLIGCQFLSAARIVTQQGNLISEKQLNRLKIGMSKTDAGIILGNSLITPTFNDDRWDYSYTIQNGEGPVLVKRVSLYFSNNKLRQINTQPYTN
jgi:outer membrane protein assembly factor BamE